jgi:hypothetical protein
LLRAVDAAAIDGHVVPEKGEEAASGQRLRHGKASEIGAVDLAEKQERIALVARPAPSRRRTGEAAEPRKGWQRLGGQGLRPQADRWLGQRQHGIAIGSGEGGADESFEPASRHPVGRRAPALPEPPFGSTHRGPPASNYVRFVFFLQPTAFIPSRQVMHRVIECFA